MYYVEVVFGPEKQIRVNSSVPHMDYMDAWKAAAWFRSHYADNVFVASSDCDREDKFQISDQRLKEVVHHAVYKRGVKAKTLVSIIEKFTGGPGINIRHIPNEKRAIFLVAAHNAPVH